MKVVLDAAFQNWILGAMIRESCNFTERLVEIDFVKTSRAKHPLSFLYRRYARRLNLIEDDLIVNHKLLYFLIVSGLINQNTLPIVRCMYTHESEDYLGSTQLISFLKQLKQVLVMNKSDAKLLANLGVDPKRIQITYGAIDRDIFFPLERYSPNRNVLVTGDATWRKNTEKIIETINANPDIFFDICGRYWDGQVRQNRILQANYKIHEFDLEKTAKLMRDSSAFLTLSRMEGGPFPVLEALSSGTPVVSTPVGWVPEIVNASNGVVVSQNSSIADISAALEKCFKLKADTWCLDLLEGKYTWGELALRFYEPSYFAGRDFK